MADQITFENGVLTIIHDDAGARTVAIVDNGVVIAPCAHAAPDWVPDSGQAVPVPDGVDVRQGDLWDGKTFTKPAPTPAAGCDDLQFRLALSQLGLRTEVELFIANANTDQAIKDWWDRSTFIERSNPLLLACAGMLDPPKTQDDIDAVIALGLTFPARGT